MEHLQQSEKIAAPSTKCSNYRSKFLVSGWKAFIYGVLDSRRHQNTIKASQSMTKTRYS